MYKHTSHHHYSYSDLLIRTALSRIDFFVYLFVCDVRSQYHFMSLSVDSLKAIKLIRDVWNQMIQLDTFEIFNFNVSNLVEIFASHSKLNLLDGTSSESNVIQLCTQIQMITLYGYKMYLYIYLNGTNEYTSPPIKCDRKNVLHMLCGDSDDITSQLNSTHFSSNKMLISKFSVI